MDEKQRHMGGGGSYFRGGNVGGGFNPFHRIADLFDGIDERADVSRDVIEEVSRGHGGQWDWKGEEQRNGGQEAKSWQNGF